MDEGDFITEIKTKGVVTYVNKDGKNMIYGGYVEYILKLLLDWLLTEPNRKGNFTL